MVHAGAVLGPSLSPRGRTFLDFGFRCSATGLDGGFIWIPRKKDLFEKLREVRDEDTKLHGYHGLKHAYSAKDFFQGKPDLQKLNWVRSEIFQMKPIERLPTDKITLYKCLYQKFLTMLYRREVLKRAKRWSDQKKEYWVHTA